MAFFRNRGTAVVITIVICVLALLLGVRRSLVSQVARIEEQFENGVYDEKAGYTLPSVADQLEVRANASLGLISLANGFDDLSEAAQRVRSAREDLLNAETIAERSAANRALTEACDELMPALQQRLEADKDVSAFADYASKMSNTARLIETSGYNEQVSAFRSEILGSFPVSVLYRLAGVRAPASF